MKKFELKNRGVVIGSGSPCFIIAEIGINHNGDLGLAKEMIREAAKCGANAVKFQIFEPKCFVTENAVVYGDAKSTEPIKQVDMLQKYTFTYDEWRELKETADGEDIMFFASVFDNQSIEIVERLNLDVFKIASCDLTNIPLIKQTASLGKLTLLSTGMSTLSEIDTAVRAFVGTGNKQLILMHCVSSYPAKIEDSNISLVRTLKKSFDLPVGFSDHCKTNYASFGAVSFGAAAIEKHFTTDNEIQGVDQEMSLNPMEFLDLVDGIRGIEKSVGNSFKTVLESEMPARINGRRSLVAAYDIPANEIIKPDMLIAKRPGTGISPSYFDIIVGRKTQQAIQKDEMIDWAKI